MPDASFLTAVAFAYVAVASLFAGVRLLVIRRFLPFHQQAVGIPWDDLPARARLLFLALMRVGGLGGLSAAVAAAVACARGSLGVSRLASLVLGAGVLVYWTGMFTVTSSVHRQTGAATPYRSSGLVAAVALVACVGLLASPQ